MRAATKEGWWHNASVEQRLAQIDGGIECGLTAGQVAMVSGSTPGAVGSFAIFYGRKFPAKNKASSASIARAGAKKRDRAAYMSGRPVDFWGNGQVHDEFALDEVPQ